MVGRLLGHALIVILASGGYLLRTIPVLVVVLVSGRRLPASLDSPPCEGAAPGDRTTRKSSHSRVFTHGYPELAFPI
jgi:hypothetical protein